MDARIYRKWQSVIIEGRNSRISLCSVLLCILFSTHKTIVQKESQTMLALIWALVGSIHNCDWLTKLSPLDNVSEDQFMWNYNVMLFISNIIMDPWTNLVNSCSDLVNTENNGLLVNIIEKYFIRWLPGIGSLLLDKAKR